MAAVTVIGLFALLVFISCWVTAPTRQRDEALRKIQQLEVQAISDEEVFEIAKFAINGTMNLSYGTHETRTAQFRTWADNVLRYLGEHFGAPYEAAFIEPMSAEDYLTDPDIPARMQRMRRRQVEALHRMTREMAGNRRFVQHAVIFPEPEAGEVTEQ